MLHLPILQLLDQEDPSSTIIIIFGSRPALHKACFWECGPKISEADAIMVGQTVDVILKGQSWVNSSISVSVCVCVHAHTGNHTQQLLILHKAFTNVNFK